MQREHKLLSGLSFVVNLHRVLRQHLGDLLLQMVPPTIWPSSIGSKMDIAVIAWEPHIAKHPK